MIAVKFLIKKINEKKIGKYQHAMTVIKKIWDNS